MLWRASRHSQRSYEGQHSYQLLHYWSCQLECWLIFEIFMSSIILNSLQKTANFQVANSNIEASDLDVDILFLDLNGVIQNSYFAEGLWTMFSQDQPGSSTATGTWLCLLVLHNQTFSSSFNIEDFYWYDIGLWVYL